MTLESPHYIVAIALTESPHYIVAIAFTICLSIFCLFLFLFCMGRTVVFTIDGVLVVVVVDLLFFSFFRPLLLPLLVLALVVAGTFRFFCRWRLRVTRAVAIFCVLLTLSEK